MFAAEAVFASAAGAEPVSVAGAELASVTAFVFVSAGASTGVSAVLCSTDTPPCKAGMEISNAVSIKTVAAMIVIFDKTDAVPRGPNAELETLLVNNAPASVLPGCSNTEPIKVMQAMKNSA